ncbi:hypothetical protein EVAR_69321_1 [Eumeta japonica]|uniref:Uncharacterized protein n=1 Tax=Eumeta variegata TaxID=151549 RepID=A0A4C1ZZ94_EUMVA|nr:hypothetical protein EVAR_69321_1 [Eumeta japonica]
MKNGITTAIESEANCQRERDRVKIEDWITNATTIGMAIGRRVGRGHSLYGPRAEAKISWAYRCALLTAVTRVTISETLHRVTLERRCQTRRDEFVESRHDRGFVSDNEFVAAAEELLWLSRRASLALSPTDPVLCILLQVVCCRCVSSARMHRPMESKRDRYVTSRTLKQIVPLYRSIHALACTLGSERNVTMSHAFSCVQPAFMDL